MVAIHATARLPQNLPDRLAIFPLPGAVLLPGARLPLNIFEPRYLAMIEDALANQRLIGMIQPKTDDTTELVSAAAPLYTVGCAGRIVSFTETEDGRFLIVLAGLCRFRIAEEFAAPRLYRTVRPDWQSYLSDLTDDTIPHFDRDKLLGLLKTYFRRHNIGVDWKVVTNAPNEVLLPTIIMISPFAPNEKQALLEAPDVTTRASMLTALLEMAASPTLDPDADSRH